MMTDQFECAFVTGFRQDQENWSQMGFIFRHRLGEKIIFIKKTDPTFNTPFLFIKYSKTTH